MVVMKVLLCRRNSIVFRCVEESKKGFRSLAAGAEFGKVRRSAFGSAVIRLPIRDVGGV